MPVKKNKISIRTMALVGMLSALVFVLSSISIPIGDTSRIHFGNIMCLLSGLLFGPWIGGIAAGFGSMLYDFTNPLYTPEFWITFLTKFAMGFVAGFLSRRIENKVPTAVRYTLSALPAAALYVVLYMVKSAIMLHFISGTPWVGVWPVVGAKGVISLVNGVLAVVVSVMLAPVLKKALESAGLFTTKQHHSAG